jgi:pimeloyl-ACP methyl ester carboxylesterase
LENKEGYNQFRFPQDQRLFVMSILHYTETGQGETLILLHSGGMNGREWDPQIASLAQRFQVIIPDQLGHGRSPMIAEQLTIGDIGREVIELMDKLAVAKAHLVGSSMGGAVALWIAVNYPDRVNKLVLFRVSYSKDISGHKGTRSMADPDYWRGLGLQQWLSDIHDPQGGPDAWKTVLNRVSQALDPTTTDHAHDLEVLAGITQPTLIIVGDRDPLVPLEQAMEMFQTIPDASLWVLPYATHVTATNTWRGDCFALEIFRFLQRRH